MTEYWLQKKTLGGWQTVSWWAEAELAKAQASYNSCSKPDSGYSWRLCKVEILTEARLDEEIEAKPTNLDFNSQSNGELIIPPLKGIWADTKPKSQWGDVPVDSSNPEHGMVGKVWMIHHQLKLKKRVDPAEVDGMIGQGYERGGPKTQFRG